MRRDALVRRHDAPAGIRHFKDGGSPTWALYSAAICCLVYLLLWGLIDVWGKTGRHGANRAAAGSDTPTFIGWNFLRLAGANPLLAYITPGIIYAALDSAGITFYRTLFVEGAAGIIRGLVFAVLVVTVAGLCNRWKILRLQA